MKDKHPSHFTRAECDEIIQLPTEDLEKLMSLKGREWTSALIKRDAILRIRSN